MKYNPIECGDRIRTLRGYMMISQAEFAEKLGVSREHIAKIEIGVKRPSIDLLINIADICLVNLDYLILGRSKNDCSKERLSAIIEELIEITRQL